VIEQLVMFVVSHNLDLRGAGKRSRIARFTDETSKRHLVTVMLGLFGIGEASWRESVAGILDRRHALLHGRARYAAANEAREAGRGCRKSFEDMGRTAAPKRRDHKRRWLRRRAEGQMNDARLWHPWLRINRVLRVDTTHPHWARSRPRAAASPPRLNHKALAAEVVKTSTRRGVVLTTASNVAYWPLHSETKDLRGPRTPQYSRLPCGLHSC
jgi:hypothetical protein